MSLPCSLSAIYLGIVVLEDLQNRQRYEQAVKELTLFLKTHSNEINLDIDDRWVRLRSLEGQNEVNIPLNCSNLRTIYYRISMESVEDETNLRKFCEIAWECCCILKENFPSRIELFQENLDQFVNIEEETFQIEMLRRQTNSLHNKLALHEQLKRDEIQDIFAILENSIILKNLKGVKACLELLESELCPPCILQQIHSSDVELLENIDSSDGALRQSLESELLVREYSDIRSLASSILCKILRAQNNGGASFDGCKENLGVVNTLKKFEASNFSQPVSKHSYLFQLKESSDIERITFILDTLLQNNISLLDELDAIGLPQVVSKLLYKYSEGDFGIDFSEVTQYCVFHNRILKYLLRLMLQNDASAVSFILASETAPALLQIIEEGILNILKNTVNLDTKEKYEKELFLRQSLEFYQSLVSPQSVISDNFKRLLRTHIISVRDITNSYLGIGQPEDLSAVPRDFRHFYVTITGFIDKVDYSLTVNSHLDHQKGKIIEDKGNTYLNNTKYQNYQNSSSSNYPKNTQLTHPRTLPKENILQNEKNTTNINLPRQQQQEKQTPNNSAILQSNRNLSPAPFSPNSDKSSQRIKLQQQKPNNPFLPRQVPLDYQALSDGEKEDGLLDAHDEDTFQDQTKDMN